MAPNPETILRFMRQLVAERGTTSLVTSPALVQRKYPKTKYILEELLDKMTKKKVETCLSCKIISISCLLGVGGYFLNLGMSGKKKPLLIIAAGSIALGVGEIFDKSPFRN